MNHTVVPASALLLLGCGVGPAGQLDDSGRATVLAATERYRQDRLDWFICSGRYSYKSEYVPAGSEAAAMQAYAITQGIAAERLLIEDQSFDTFSNLLFTARDILQSYVIRRLVVCGGPNHTTAKLNYLCRKVFGANIEWMVLDRFADRPGEAAREADSLHRLQQLFDTVADGHLADLEHAMRTRHPAYATDRSRAA